MNVKIPSGIESIIPGIFKNSGIKIQLVSVLSVNKMLFLELESKRSLYTL